MEGWRDFLGSGVHLESLIIMYEAVWINCKLTYGSVEKFSKLSNLYCYQIKMLTLPQKEKKVVKYIRFHIYS